MRIFSKFRDYYDNTGYYSKEDRVWERKTEYIDIEVRPKYAYADRTANRLSDDTEAFLVDAFSSLPSIRHVFSGNTMHSDPDDTFIVGFCGKMYLGIAHFRPESDIYSFPTFRKLHNTYSSYLEYMEAREAACQELQRGNIKEGGLFSSTPFTKQGIETWNSVYKEHPSLPEIFVELGAPLFIMQPIGLINREKSKSNLVVNPCMADYKLQYLFHPFIAHQEIDMYLNNDLATCDLNDFNMSDELKRDSKGFDNWSFKQKGPKKRKQK